VLIDKVGRIQTTYFAIYYNVRRLRGGVLVVETQSTNREGVYLTDFYGTPLTSGASIWGHNDQIPGVIIVDTYNDSDRMYDYEGNMLHIWSHEIGSNLSAYSPFLWSGSHGFFGRGGTFGILQVTYDTKLIPKQDAREPAQEITESPAEPSHLTQVEAEAMFREGFSYLNEDDFEVFYEGEFIIPYNEWTQFGSTVFTEELGGLEAYLFYYWIRVEDGSRWEGMTAITFDGREISTMSRRILE
jgi:hypothetical protein